MGGELNPSYRRSFFLHLWIVFGRIIGIIKFGPSLNGGRSHGITLFVSGTVFGGKVKSKPILETLKFRVGIFLYSIERNFV
mgnify:CR=1 FL=1